MVKHLVSSAAAVAGIAFSLAAMAQLPPIPPNIATATPRPMMMLNMSKDHQLFYRAYDEYSDLDGDKQPETTYKHSFNYYGYFDTNKCYSYGSGVFTPVSVTSTKYCSGNWSGNFLNWATMARIDVVRKVLYGGYRSTDTATETVLERTHLPTDAHSFAKYYKGSDLPQLTPFDATQIAPTRTRDNNDVRRIAQYDAGQNRNYTYPSGMVPSGAPTGSCQAVVDAYYASTGGTAPPDYNCVWFKTGSNFDTSFTPELGDQMRATFDSLNNGIADFTVEQERINGIVVALDSNQNFTMMVPPEGFTGTSATVRRDWIFSNVSQTSATMCNTTLGDSNSGSVNYWSHTNTNPPLMRIARGDYQLWNANERWQCYWSGEKGASNGNNVAITGLGSASSNPDQTSRGVMVGGDGPNFIVRVKVCDSTLLGNERCQRYPSGNYKPVGLLHEYGEPNLAEFGLVTGSFAKNISGGVVRSNMQSFRNEVNYTTDGTFTSAQGIVYNLNRLRVYGYRYDDGTYIGDGNCTYQLTGLSDNQCTSWGNPLGEMFLESLRYLGGKAASSAFTYTSSGSKDNAMGLSQPAWVDPFLRSGTTERANIENTFGKAQCRAINVLNFNASVTSYDHDQQANFANLPAAPSVDSLVNTIGVDEGIHGSSWFVGMNGSTNDRTCTAKSVTSLASVRGICPDGPAYYGAYGLAGMAYWAHVNPIRNDISTSGNPDKAFRVKTYGVSLAPGKPRITVTDPANPSRTVVIQPAYKLDLGGGNVGGGTLVDFRVISQNATSGKYLVIWEDSEQGGDYDQDASGILRYEVKADGKLYVYTRTFAAATANPQGFGYTISGTNKDGVHFHSGIIGFNFSDLTNLTVYQQNADGTTTTHAKINSSGGCNNCQVNDAESVAVYSFSTSAAAGILQEPMWYAAKWGGFNDSTPPTNKPDVVSKWDSKRGDGSLGSDGTPDTYFLAFRADLLEQALRSVFNDIIGNSNTAPAVAAAQLTEGGLKYVVSFQGNDGHGEISAFALQADSSFSANPSWKAHEKLTASASRQIITNVTATTTVALTWAAMPDSVKSATFGGLGADAQARLQWVRGVRTNEAPNGYRFRARNQNSIMGSIINSNPVVQGAPGAAFVGSAFSGYTTFRNANLDRTPVLWVGSNDGMLHGFNATASASGGEPIISYLPGPLLSRAALWSDPNSESVLSGMDGTPVVGDVKVGTNWATYLFASLGRGGRGIFALDVTNPANMNEGNASSVFKWQFGPADDADIGYILSAGRATNPSSLQAGQIARMANGKFAVLYGNGYESPSGKAVLYILFVDGPDSSGNWGASGTRFVKLVADSGSGNGLSQPMWVDTNSDGIADFIYAGDLKGNLWKFNVQSSSPGSWNVAYEGNALFIAKNSDAASTPTLSITAVPRFVFHPFGGPMITFATGKAVRNGDFPDTTRQDAMFGIWDKPGYAALSGGALTAALPRALSTLATRTYVAGTSSASSYITGEAIDWSTKKGWYTKFPVTSEASVANPSQVGDLVAFPSLVPAAAGDSCFGQPQNFTTFVNPVSGLLDIDVLGTVDVSVTEVYNANRVATEGNVSFAQGVNTQQTQSPIPPGGGSGSEPCKGPDCSCNANQCSCTGPNCCIGSACTLVSGNASCTSASSCCMGTSCCTGKSSSSCTCTTPPCNQVGSCEPPAKLVVGAVNTGEGPKLCMRGTDNRLSWREIPTFKTGTQ